MSTGAQSVEQESAEWLARRDRGLSASEHRQYLRWLQTDPTHRFVMEQHQAVLERLMHLRTKPGERRALATLGSEGVRLRAIR
jgi:ferric-dicitrate binding protein FerR (iron transport regulator)